MARPPGPWWWKARNCWACTVEGKRIVDRSGIPKSDPVAAHLWWKSVRTDESEIPYGTHTVGDLLDLYLDWDEYRAETGERSAEGHLSLKSKLRTIGMTEVNGEPLKDLRASRMTPAIYDALLAVWLRAGLSPGYRQSLASYLQTVFRWASQSMDGIMAFIPSNPLDGCKLPKVPPPDERFAERSEAAAWLRWLWRNPKIDRGYVLLQRCLIHTGARPSEWTRARWRELNWMSRPLPLLTRKDWKNAKKTRTVRRVYVPVKLHRALKRLDSASTLDDLIFTTTRGKQWTAAYLSNFTQDAREAAVRDGATIQSEGTSRVTCYLWRHVAASNLLMSGIDIATVAKLLGTSVKHIAETYGHLMDDHLAVAAQRMTRPR